MKLPTPYDTSGLFRSRTFCKDGFNMSVQASHGHYCTPRIDAADEYTAVEVGYPSASEELLMPYIDGSADDPTDTVYAYVPMTVIDAVISKHGGLA